MCFHFLYNFFILRRIERGIIKIYIGAHVKYPLFLPDFREFEFSRQILKIYSNIIFHKNRPVEAEFSHEDRRTDMMKLIVTFRNFAKEPKD